MFKTLKKKVLSNKRTWIVANYLYEWDQGAPQGVPCLCKEVEFYLCNKDIDTAPIGTVSKSIVKMGCRVYDYCNA
jgi:hypothetical protein